MRVRTWSACVALAWGILLIITAAGPMGSSRPAQANTRIASITSTTSNIGTIGNSDTTRVTLTSSVTATPAWPPAVRPDTAAASAAARPAARSGAPTDTGASTAAIAGQAPLPGQARASAATSCSPVTRCRASRPQLASPAAGPALYAANRRSIGPDPGLIRPGTVLVLPGRATQARYYTVEAGETLSGIAAAVGVRGGWPALYAANRRSIGPDPDVIRVGTVLAIPHPASPASHQTSPRLHRTRPRRHRPLRGQGQCRRRRAHQRRPGHRHPHGRRRQ